MPKKKNKNLNPPPEKKNRSVAAWLLAIFCLLLLWFLLWLYDWYRDLFGLSVNKNVAGSTVTDDSQGGDKHFFTTIENNPIQYITKNLPSYGYAYKQSGAATVWTINHKFGYVPTVTLYNLQGEQIYGIVNAPVIENWIEEYQEYQRTVETVTVTFAEAEAGYAVFS